MNKWWSFRFRMTWPQNQNPNWWIDVFIFDTIVRQVLRDNGKDIFLWRVHRRANNRDESGHQFTFFCYSAHKTAKSINQKIVECGALTKLNDAGLLDRYFWEEEGLDKNNKANIEDTSDKKAWTIEIQRSWPFFIKGVSEMLLELIAQVKEQIKDNPPDLDVSSISSIQSYYVQVANRLSHLWQTKGSHAFLHHINALFGYVPVNLDLGDGPGRVVQVRF